MSIALSFGQSVAGLLVDGVDGTPYTGATLQMEHGRGVVVEVPYIHYDQTGQFNHIDEWFQKQTPPENLILETPSGVVGLYGIRWQGTSVRSGVSLGQLRPSETLLGQCEAPLDEKFKVREARSEIDGLREWTRFYGIDTESERDEEGLTQGLVVRVRSGGEATWRQGEATMKLVTQWKTDHPEEDPHGGLNIAESVVLTSSFPTPRPFTDHLAEQRKIVSLVTLLSGRPVHFRRHQVADEMIVMRSLGNTILSRPREDLISRHTVREYEQPRPKRNDFDELLARLPEIGEAGLTTWAEQYEPWRRFILPAVGVLGRRDAFTEDVIISTSMSIEAAGQLIGRRDGEEATCNQYGATTTATNVYRCLHLLEVKWGTIAADYASLAKAVANTYNDIKHFDRGEFPDAPVSHLISIITRMIVRLLALHIIDGSGTLLKDHREDGAMWKIQQWSDLYHLTFNERGKAVFSTAEEAETGS